MDEEEDDEAGCSAAASELDVFRRFFSSPLEASAEGTADCAKDVDTPGTDMEARGLPKNGKDMAMEERDERLEPEASVAALLRPLLDPPELLLLPLVLAADDVELASGVRNLAAAAAASGMRDEEEDAEVLFPPEEDGLLSESLTTTELELEPFREVELLFPPAEALPEWDAAAAAA